MSFSLGKDESEAMAEINIIPLVDVMLVLLIVFMVTAPLSISGIKVDLPVSQAKGTSIDEDRIVLSIGKGGEFFLDKIQIPAVSLPDRLKAIYAYRQKKEIYIRADGGVTYSKVLEAMSAAKTAGVQRMSMLTQPPTRAAAR